MRVEVLGDGRIVDVIRRELDTDEQNRIAEALAAEGISVAPVVDVFHTLHLWAQDPMTTEQEVRALTAFRAVTDCRLAWHEAPRGEA